MNINNFVHSLQAATVDGKTAVNPRYNKGDDIVTVARSIAGNGQAVVKLIYRNKKQSETKTGCTISTPIYLK